MKKHLTHSRVLLLSFLTLSVGALLSSCAPSIVTEYRIDVQQGNVISQQMVDRLKPGQTRRQVRAILGTPTLTDLFHADRWDYPYQLKDGRTNAVEGRIFSVFFDKEGNLSSVSGDIAIKPEPKTKQPDVEKKKLKLFTTQPDSDLQKPDGLAQEKPLP